MADFPSVALSHAHNRFQHIKYYGEPPELSDFNESNEILGGLMYRPPLKSPNLTLWTKMTIK